MNTFTDCDGTEITTDDPVHERFIADMNAAEIPWRVYSGRGMFGRQCPSVYTGHGTEEADVYRATKLLLNTDAMGLGRVLYTG